MLGACFPCGSLVAQMWACDLDPAKQTPSSLSVYSGNCGDSSFVVGWWQGKERRLCHNGRQVVVAGVQQW